MSRIWGGDSRQARKVKEAFPEVSHFAVPCVTAGSALPHLPGWLTTALQVQDNEHLGKERW